MDNPSENDPQEALLDPEEAEHGKVFLSWEFPERPRYKRGVVWYAAFLTIGGALLIYSVISANFLFALIILLIGLVLYLSLVIEPSDLRIAVTEDGIEIGHAFYPYKEIENFWFVYEPPAVRNLYIEFRGVMRPRIRVDLAGQNPNKVRTHLGKFVREDLEQDDEPLSDVIGRLLKI